MIAAKPLKPCDGGVFRGLFFAPVSGAAVPLRAVDAPVAGQGKCCGPVSESAGQTSGAWASAAFRSRLHAGNHRRFATSLIAAKPLKPCDGGVFGALNLLLISERARSGKAGWIPFSPSAARNRIREASPKPARRLIGFRPPPFALVCAMNRALPCPACDASDVKPRFQSLFSAGP